MINKNEIRKSSLDLVKSMLEDGVLEFADLQIFVKDGKNECSPEYLRKHFEDWYISMGIEYLTGKPFSLSLPFFTEEEIQSAYEKGEIIVCVPANINRKILSKLFHFTNCSMEEPLITDTTEKEDFWFKTSKSLMPEHKDKEGREIKKIYNLEGKLGMTIERYMVFVAYMMYVLHLNPDTIDKTWITLGTYEKKAMLIAGFDSNRKFAVQAWMPNFHTPMVGGRAVEIVDHLYL